METDTKIMIGASVIGAGALAWYLTRPKTAAVAATVNKTALPAQGATAAPVVTATPVVPAVPPTVSLLLTSDGLGVIRAPIGAKLVPTSSFGSQWDSTDVPHSSVPGVLTPNGDGTFTAAAAGGTSVNGSAIDQQASSYPMSATVIIS